MPWIDGNSFSHIRPALAVAPHEVSRRRLLPFSSSQDRQDLHQSVLVSQIDMQLALLSCDPARHAPIQVGQPSAAHDASAGREVHRVSGKSAPAAPVPDPSKLVKRVHFGFGTHVYKVLSAFKVGVLLTCLLWPYPAEVAYAPRPDLFRRFEPWGLCTCPVDAPDTFWCVVLQSLYCSSPLRGRSTALLNLESLAPSRLSLQLHPRGIIEFPVCQWLGTPYDWTSTLSASTADTIGTSLRPSPQLYMCQSLSTCLSTERGTRFRCSLPALSVAPAGSGCSIINQPNQPYHDA
ncbi:uncharacterized protein LY79DRAFT_578122 [Colletotrichum navitas]|uniref:Uncharacterized protein n=1 Tax=Colletotrichum navitas TaxID=681940 RepID=A0AAD8Q3N4_9PEZI|nr:uncharacterized protein LY79DRAFT_578122 [Colletotrichum navitas]KAK1595351.1 hypothetical protein LY79DRAFT_578122 [Colletotrichum navitas]